MTDITAAPARSRMLSFAIGVAGGFLGLLPWLLTGLRLPLQNLWATATMPDEMPLALLPVSQYYATQIFALLLLGGVFAGLAVHIVGSRRALAAWPAALGVMLLHVIAIVQSFAVVGAGLRDGSDSTVYLVGLLGGAVASALCAQLGFLMTSRRSVGVAAFGVALAAAPFATWASTLIVAFTGEVFPPAFLPEFVRWLPGVVVGAALIWCGVRPFWRLVVWAVSLLALWIMPALFTAIMYSLGSRVMLGDFPEMLAASVQLFPMVLAEVWMPVIAAAVIGVVGTVVRMLVQRSRAEAHASPAVADESARAGVPH
ncbi:hypothetical protein QFZ53_000753 [Microbacterium natoriense]|uniref:Integral membrane protein n=1 Tax=Microbacterium natoriense TaxID=284570 RepID=A0AAW8ETV7_9MICO|nr:hypothetical protein [Microbacterium natoriense]MDQ0646557.1 hypothetical protein [Microbacterium natoriense]